MMAVTLFTVGDAVPLILVGVFLAACFAGGALIAWVDSWQGGNRKKQLREDIYNVDR